MQITGVDETADPGSIDGMPCHSQLTVIYTVTIHIVPNGPGGNLDVFHSFTGNENDWTPSPQVSVQPGQTTATYTFTDTGTIAGGPGDPMFPRWGYALVVLTQHNTFQAKAIPTGMCY